MKKEEYLIVGGVQRSTEFVQERHRYKTGIVLKVDFLNQTASTVFEHVTPPEYCAQDGEPSILFKAGHLEQDRLYLCTQTEVLILSFPELNRIGYFTHPWMNDVHHVRPGRDGTIIVTSTGLDSVLVFSDQGELLEQKSVLSDNTWDFHDKSQDYRKIASTKPHRSHPNFTFYRNDEMWVTRLRQRDAVSLTSNGANGQSRIAIETEKPHDGVVHNGKLYFTTVDGHIVVFDLESLQRLDEIDLNSIDNIDISLGWCRSIHIKNEDQVIVGFSRFRPTKWKDNLQWVKFKLGVSQHTPERPTRIVEYDLRSRQKTREMDLEPFGIGEIFSIFPCS